MVSAIDTLAAFSRITDGRTTETRNAELFKSTEHNLFMRDWPELYIS